MWSSTAWMVTATAALALLAVVTLLETAHHRAEGLRLHRELRGRRRTHPAA